WSLDGLERNGRAARLGKRRGADGPARNRGTARERHGDEQKCRKVKPVSQMISAAKPTRGCGCASPPAAPKPLHSHPRGAVTLLSFRRILGFGRAREAPAVRANR